MRKAEIKSKRPRRPRRSDAPALVEAWGPPISQVGWSPQLVAQTLEVLPVGLAGTELFWLKPVHADSLRVGLPVSTQPAQVVLDVLGWYNVEARVIHSTSWRHQEGTVILTYLAVVEPPGRLPPDSLVSQPVGRAELARGTAIGAPRQIGVGAVVEHALRHLAWLLREDRAIAEALPAWKEVLARYEPEPFQALA